MKKFGETNAVRIYSDAERQAPTDLKEAEPSHLARYQFALKFISLKDTVLDAPCGSGYGTKLISSLAKNTKGIDIHKETIGHAKEFFGQQNNSFFVGNIENMKETFPDDNVFDVVVSFEGIEHIKNPNSFLSEIKRLLKKDGKLIISTPREPHGSPYHIKEYKLSEFKELLEKQFNVEKVFGQIYTDIFDLSEREVDPYDFKRFNFIAVCDQK